MAKSARVTIKLRMPTKPGYTNPKHKQEDRPAMGKDAMKKVAMPMDAMKK